MCLAADKGITAIGQLLLLYLLPRLGASLFVLQNILLRLAAILVCVTMVACGEEDGFGLREDAAAVEAVNQLLDEAARKELFHSPETATQLGLSAEVAGYQYFAKLDDRSEAGLTRIALERIATLNALDQIDISELPEQLSSSVYTIRSAYRSAVDFRAFGYGQVSLGFARPYAVDQLSGGYIDVPDLLLNRQPVRVLDEAVFYIRRLQSLADTIHDERRKLEADNARGIAPPSFILDRMRILAVALSSADTPTHPLVDALENQMIGLVDIPEPTRERLLGEANQIVTRDVIPAYQSFIETLDTLALNASDLPGIWQIDRGNEYYLAALQFYSGRTTSPQDMHNEGLALVDTLSERLNQALIDLGFVEGSIAERLQAIGAQADQQFANDEAGRAALIESLQSKLRNMQAKLGDFVETPPSTSVSVAPVPDFLAQTAPGGYYIAAPEDGTTPGLFFINLRDTMEWPAFTLPTLLYHETFPGHHLESAIVSEQVNLPLIRQLIWNAAFGEGWAVYAEDLAYEFGAYADDPMGELGYLQSLLFRAARLVVDTGLHHERWSRERAINYLVETTGQPASAMTTEIDRYSVWPGQATSYMSGRQTLHALRRKAESILGDGFSLKSYHAVILGNGPRPLELIESEVEAWIIQTLERAS